MSITYYFYGLLIPVPINEMTLWVTARFFGQVNEKERAALPKPGPHIIEWAIPGDTDPSTVYGLAKMPLLCHGYADGFVIYEPKFAPHGTEVTIRDAINIGTWEFEPRF